MIEDKKVKTTSYSVRYQIDHANSEITEGLVKELTDIIQYAIFKTPQGFEEIQNIKKKNLVALLWPVGNTVVFDVLIPATTPITGSPIYKEKDEYRITCFNLSTVLAFEKYAITSFDKNPKMIMIRAHEREIFCPIYRQSKQRVKNE